MNKNYSFGAGAIASERWEQMHKHGWTILHDVNYTKDELLQAAMFCINPEVYSWPIGWSERFKDKILDKDKINRLRVAGAFIAAAIDREHYLLNSEQGSTSE
jgi:hypothetical protein